MNRTLNIFFMVAFIMIATMTMPATQLFHRDSLSHYALWLAFFCAVGGLAHSIYVFEKREKR